MENNKLNEKANVADEVLDDISGGLGNYSEILCPFCRQYVPKFTAVKHKNRLICRECMAKINE